MTPTEQIAWLEDFINRWNGADEEERLILASEYQVWTAKYQHPLISADELLAELILIEG